MYCKRVVIQLNITLFSVEEKCPLEQGERAEAFAGKKNMLHLSHFSPIPKVFEGGQNTPLVPIP